MPFDVTRFSQREFHERLANKDLSADFIRSNPTRFEQAAYIAGYLDHLKAKTIVIEDDYIDRDYIADYSAYYASCFDQYGPHCRRLHFFDFDFSRDDLAAWILTPNKDRDKELNQHYLGFVVVRPLPEAVVGRTVLKTYSDPDSDRHYCAIRRYDVSLFGISLTVNSLAYQQQDTVVAACATVALWSGSHKTSHLFHHRLLRPTEITSAANRVQGGGRAMPSAGLRIEQICAAIRRADLEPLAEQVNSKTALMSMIYGYLAFGLPVILLGVVAECSYAGHAVTITGYSLATAPVAIREQTVSGLTSIGHRIEKLYTHDDNLGPFARTFPVSIPNAVPGKYRDAPFALQEQDPNGSPEYTIVPVMAVVPVYEKIRLQYSEAHAWAGNMRFLMSRLGVPVDDLEWKIGLTDIQHYKRLLREKYHENANATSLLTASLPRFMWRAVATRGGNKVLELVIDATGVSRSCPVLALLWHEAHAEAEYRSQRSRLSKSAVEATFGQRFANVVY